MGTLTMFFLPGNDQYLSPSRVLTTVLALDFDVSSCARGSCPSHLVFPMPIVSTDIGMSSSLVAITSARSEILSFAQYQEGPQGGQPGL